MRTMRRLAAWARLARSRRGAAVREAPARGPGRRRPRGPDGRTHSVAWDIEAGDKPTSGSQDGDLPGPGPEPSRTRGSRDEPGVPARNPSIQDLLLPPASGVVSPGTECVTDGRARGATGGPRHPGAGADGRLGARPCGAPGPEPGSLRIGRAGWIAILALAATAAGAAAQPVEGAAPAAGPRGAPRSRGAPRPRSGRRAPGRETSRPASRPPRGRGRRTAARRRAGR